MSLSLALATAKKLLEAQRIECDKCHGFGRNAPPKPICPPECEHGQVPDPRYAGLLVLFRKECPACIGTLVRNAALTCTVSNEFVKTAFAPLPDADFMALRPMQFEYISAPGRTRWGFGAMQVASVNPALADGWRSDGLPWSLDQNAILALTVKTVQELSEKINKLEIR